MTQNIEKIELENFRGIEFLSFETNRINIIIGRNNTGKSSILEGIALLLSSQNGYNDFLENNMIDYLTEKRRYPLKYLIYANENSATIRATLKQDQLELKLNYYADEQAPQNSHMGYLMEFFLNKVSQNYEIYQAHGMIHQRIIFS